MSFGPATASIQRRAPAAPSSADLVVADDRPVGIVRFESEMVSLFIDAAALLGVPKSVAAVYGVLFASPRPLSFSEISARLRFSNGSVSQALKALREIGAIRIAAPRFPLPAPRSQLPSARSSFEPDTEMRRLIQRFLEQRVEAQLSQGMARLTVLATAAAAYDVAERKILDQRLKKLGRWHDRTRALMPVVRAFLKLGKL